MFDGLMKTGRHRVDEDSPARHASSSILKEDVRIRSLVVKQKTGVRVSVEYMGCTGFRRLFRLTG